ncbi:MAG: hypothetical protein PUD15_03420 [Prevotella sp.]|nr:hypothetical protein [Prevotella sp. AGR2160]MDD5861597.1 hypothetical protein [Prevotella sp.]
MMSDFTNYVMALVFLIVGIWLFKKITFCLFRILIAVFFLAGIYYFLFVG